ncbi:hypothetical protein Tcan_08470 [Toxocara canis]|uniref:Uncharacterized protein n=1 Tax=Toxocara canis TaxID=6265 RepID=A0A0B2VG72_TOXCA|nr:hypothetical protein Tcan_08470 [Toxocara canis]
MGPTMISRSCKRKKEDAKNNVTMGTSFSQELPEAKPAPSAAEPPQRSWLYGKMRSKANKGDKKRTASTKPNEIHMRINFLHHAAQLLFSESKRGEHITVYCYPVQGQKNAISVMNPEKLP